MRKTSNRFGVVFMAAVGVLSLSSAVTAQTILYSQNFDGISGTTLPAGWTISNSANTLVGSAGASIAVGSISGTQSGNSYVFFDGADKSIGLLNSGSFTSGKRVSYVYTNDTGGDLTALELSWNYEKFRTGSRQWTWSFASTVGTPGTLGNAIYAANANNTVRVIESLPVAPFSLSGFTLGNGQTATFTWTLTGNGGSSNGQALAIDDFFIKVPSNTTPPKDVTWTGATDGNWDISTQNWVTGGSTPAAFAAGDSATFDDSVTVSNTSVNLVPAGISAGAVNFLSSQAFTFNGGPLTTSQGLNKTGSGDLTIKVPVSGSVSLTAGRLVLGSNGSLGGALTVNAATLAYIPDSPSTTSVNTVTVGTSGATFEVAPGSTLALSGVTTPAGPGGNTKILKTGDGVLAIGAALTNNRSFALGVTGGRLELNAPSGTQGVSIAAEWAAATSGDLLIGGAFRLNVAPLEGQTTAAIGSPEGTGSLIFARPQPALNSSQIPVFSVTGFGGSPLTIDLNLGVVLDARDTSGNSVATASDRYAIGANDQGGVGNRLNINKPITGTGTLLFGGAGAGGPFVSNGTGVTVLNAQSTFTGSAAVATLLTGVVRAGIDNPLPTGNLLTFGDPNAAPTFGGGTNTAVGSLDLNGKQLQVGALASNPNILRQNIGGVVNTGGASTLVLNGTADATYAGPIGLASPAIAGNANLSGANGDIAVVKNGESTQVLSGVIQITGAVTNNAGKLILPGNTTEAYIAPTTAGSLIATGGTIEIAASTGNIPNTSTVVPAVTIVNSITTSGTGFIDLKNNDLIVRTGNVGALRTSVAAWLASNPATGLGSTTADKVTTTLAVFPNTDPTTGLEFFNTYDGVTLGASDVLVKYTYVGDTNVDGKVDATDLVNALEGFSTGLTGWENGDFNYDGAVTAIDIDALTFVLGQNLTPLSSGNPTGGLYGSGAIPEPAALGLLAAVIPMVTRRRRVK